MGGEVEEDSIPSAVLGHLMPARAWPWERAHGTYWVGKQGLPQKLIGGVKFPHRHLSYAVWHSLACIPFSCLACHDYFRVLAASTEAGKTEQNVKA